MTCLAVAVGAQGPQSPGFRVRASLLRRPLGRCGVDLDPQPLFDAAGEAEFRAGSPVARARVLVRSRQSMRRVLRAPYDAVLVQRQVDMLPTLGLERLAARGRRLVLDVDDAIWHDASPSAGGSSLAWVKGSARRVRWLAQRADAIVAGNEILAEWLSDHGGPVAVIPSLVDVDATPLRTHRDSGEIVLGWIGSASTSAYLQRIVEALQRAARELQGKQKLRLVVLGGSGYKCEGIEVEHIRWSEERERKLLARMDIGLMPLPDTPWTRGKCAYKAIQYMAAGVPVIADDVGISATAIGDQAAGLIVTGTTDWTEAIVELAKSAHLRDRLGSEGRRRAETHYSVRRWVPELGYIIAGGA